MTDYFAVMREQRRPWLDPEILKQRFLALSAEAHPDRGHASGAQEKATMQERYTELNAAYQCLRDPKQRLRHLLELEHRVNQGQVQQVPAALMNVSLEVGQACREADALLGKKAKSTSPLLQLQIFERAQAETEKLTAIQRGLESLREGLITEVKLIDACWNVVTSVERATQVARLEELYPLMSYYERWAGQVRERVVQLSL